MSLLRFDPQQMALHKRMYVLQVNECPSRKKFKYQAEIYLHKKIRIHLYATLIHHKVYFHLQKYFQNEHVVFKRKGDLH